MFELDNLCNNNSLKLKLSVCFNQKKKKMGQ